MQYGWVSEWLNLTAFLSPERTLTLITHSLTRKHAVNTDGSCSRALLHLLLFSKNMLTIKDWKWLFVIVQSLKIAQWGSSWNQLWVNHEYQVLYSKQLSGDFFSFEYQNILLMAVILENGCWEMAAMVGTYIMIIIHAVWLLGLQHTPFPSAAAYFCLPLGGHQMDCMVLLKRTLILKYVSNFIYISLTISIQVLN